MVCQASNAQFPTIKQLTFDQCQQLAIKEPASAECRSQEREQTLMHVSSTYTIQCGGHETKCECHCPDCSPVRAQVHSHCNCPTCPENPRVTERWNQTYYREQRIRIVVLNQTERHYTANDAGNHLLPPVICYPTECPECPKGTLSWECISMGAVVLILMTAGITYVVTKKQQRRVPTHTTVAQRALTATTPGRQRSRKSLFLTTTFLLFLRGRGPRRPVARFQDLVGHNTFLRGHDFCFNCMFKTNFSRRNKIWRGTKEI